MEEVKKMRQSNFELLRIIAMFLIVLTHLVVQGVIRQDTTISDSLFNGYFARVFSLGGKFGNEIFIIITGYFGVTSKFSYKKLIDLIRETHLYALLCLFVTILILQNVSIQSVIFSLFPVLFGTYWFISTYIILMLVSPLINQFIESSEDQTKFKILGLLVLVFSILPSIQIQLNSSVGIFDFGLFVLLYYIGALIRIYNISRKIKFAHISLVAILFNILNIVIMSSIYIIGVVLKKENLVLSSDYFSRQESIFLLLAAVSFFVLFSKIEISSNRVINKVSSTTFGIYLIHENLFFHQYVYTSVLKVQNFISYPTINFIFSILFYTLVVFVFCMTIDLLRQRLFLISKVKEINERSIVSIENCIQRLILKINTIIERICEYK